jgi:hypothetical protein
VFFVDKAGMNHRYRDLVLRQDNNIPIDSRIFLMKKSAFPDSVFVCKC